MPFDYVSVPQIPIPNVADPIPETAVTSKVTAVSNTVNVGGYLVYNVSTTQYDVLYPGTTGFPTINVGGTLQRANLGQYTELKANSNTDILYVRGAGVSLTTNGYPRTLSISTTSDLRVSQNSVIQATNNWTIRISANDLQTWAGVTWSPELGIFAAVTSITPGATVGGQRIGTSTDGINWTPQVTPANNTYRRVIWAPELGLFVAVASTGTLDRVMTSPDGNTWTSRVSANNNFLDVTWSKERNLLVAVASSQVTGNDHIMTSSNGVTWTSQTSASNSQIFGVTWAKELGIFAAVCGTGDVTGQQVQTSPDGITWTLQTTPNNNQWQKVAWSPELGLFAAVSANGSTDRVMTSPDGITWTARVTSASLITWTDIIWAPQFEAFVAVGNNSSPAGAYDRVMISFDGITWTNLYSPSLSAWQAVTWSPELGILVATASSGTTGQRTMTSKKVGMWRTIESAASNTSAASAYYSRGSDWVLRTPAANVNWEAVTWADRLNLFVAVSSNTTSVPGPNRVMTSPEGINWTSRVTPNDTPYVAIAYNGNVLVAVSSTQQANQVMISTDAITWQRGVAAANVGWRGITWNGNIFCAVAQTGVANGVMISTDGTTWSTRVPAADNAWRNVIWVKELSLFVAVGTSGAGNRVMTSPDGTTWTSRSCPDQSWISLAWNGKLIVAVAFSGSNNRVMTSPDGINWTSRYTPVDNQWTYILWTGTQFVVVANTGNGDRLMTSPDGINWTIKASPSDAVWKGLAWNSQVLVAVAQSPHANTVATWTEDNILMAGDGIILSQNSRANTLTFNVNVSSITTGTLSVARGGTGQSSYTNGQILIGNTGNGGLDTATVSQSAPIIVTNLQGSITLSHARSGVTAATYGSASLVPVLTVDDNGHITVVTTAAIVASPGVATANGQLLVGNTVSSSFDVYTPAQSAPIIVTVGKGTIVLSHARSGVTGATYGSQSLVPVFAVDANGHLTSVTDTAIGGLATTVLTTGILSVARGGTGKDATGLANGQLLIANTVNSGFDLAVIAQTDPVIVTVDKGSIRVSHARSGVTAATLGGSNRVLGYTVDANGHITTTSNVAIDLLPASAISTGILSVARGGTGKDATGIANGQLLIGNTVNSGFDLAVIAQSAPVIVTVDKGAITISHARTTVVPATYGSQSLVPVFAVDANGHLTSVTDTAIGGLATTVLTTGILSVARGGTGKDATGLANGQLLIGNTVNSGFDLATIAQSAPIIVTIPGKGAITISHARSGVTAVDSYGSQAIIPVFAVDANGHLTAVVNTAIGGLATTVLTTGILSVARGGTGKDATGLANGQLLIANTVNSGFDLATVTAGSGIIITNDKGSITVTLSPPLANLNHSQVMSRISLGF